MEGGGMGEIERGREGEEREREGGRDRGREVEIEGEQVCGCVGVTGMRLDTMLAGGTN